MQMFGLSVFLKALGVLFAAGVMFIVGVFCWHQYFLFSDCYGDYLLDSIPKIAKTSNQGDLYYDLIDIVFEDATNCMLVTTRLTNAWIDESVFECIPFCVLVVYQDGTACDPYSSMCVATELDKKVGPEKCLDYYILKARKEWDRLGMDMCGGTFWQLSPEDQLLILRAYWPHKFSPSPQTLQKENDLNILLTKHQYSQHENRPH